MGSPGRPPFDALTRRRRQVAQYAGLAALIWALTGYILYPALSTLVTSVSTDGAFSLGRYAAFFTSANSLEVLTNSIVLGGLTVLCCGAVGAGLAFFINYFEFPCKRLVDKLLLLPVMMPGIIIVYAFVQLYGESGLVTKTLQLVLGLKEPPFGFSGLPGILFVHAYTQYVYFYIAASLAIRQMDYSAIESARSLGASRLKVLTSVIRPFLTPALVTASAVTFMTGIGSFTAPSIIGAGYKVLTTRILLSKANNYMGMAAVEVVVLTSISILFFLALRRYEKKKLFSPSVKRTPVPTVRIKNPVLKGATLMAAGVLIFFILLPFVTIIALSFVDSASWMVNIYPEKFTFDNFLAIFTKQRTLQPFVNSVNMAFIAAFFCLIIAIPASYVIERTKSRLRWLIDFLTMLPWAMPASAVAINIINANSRPTMFSFNAVLIGSFILLPLGYFIKSLPIVVKTSHISFQNLDDALLEASKSLGASELKTFTRVTLPILYPGLLAGFLLAFVRSVGEYTVSAFLYTPSNRPISIAMVNAVFDYNIGLAMAYGTLLILLTILLSLLISGLRLQTFHAS